MDRRITRRDFLNGMTMTIGAASLPHGLRAQTASGEPQDAAGYYPPKLTGMRGSYPGSFTVAHAVRDGSFWDSAGQATETGENYDLVVVGGGISGLASARFYREVFGSSARILVLEVHDDFGGHAKRNEFDVNGRKLLGFGGTYAIESPAPYSPVAKRVVNELGIDVSSFSRVADQRLFASLGLEPKIFFDQETFGADRLVLNPYPIWGGKVAASQQEAWKRFAAEAPLNEKAKADFQRLHTSTTDP
ncbi:MAG: NAD(P)/FAD-dependent oxidoreductase, partial [Acetobacteraceae bacterium]|nr:NAD(P)/FAD-dependent oxidoreductase [Acetobacteraceae bacterium]